MSRQLATGAYRIFFALLTIVAMVVQAYHVNDVGEFSLGNYLSYFTIESNILAALLLLFLALRANPDASSPTLDYVRGAVTLYMTVTGVVYGLLLSGYTQEVQTSLDWVDTVVHRILPIVMFADWMINPPKFRLDFKRALIWLAYPVVYLAYTLIRGPIVDWYPYPFLDPDHPDYAQGYWRVALFCAGIAAGFAVFTWIIVWVGNLRGEKTASAPPLRPASSPS